MQDAVLFNSAKEYNGFVSNNNEIGSHNFRFEFLVENDSGEIFYPHRFSSGNYCWEFMIRPKKFEHNVLIIIINNHVFDGDFKLISKSKFIINKKRTFRCNVNYLFQNCIFNGDVSVEMRDEEKFKFQNCTFSGSFRSKCRMETLFQFVRCHFDNVVPERVIEFYNLGYYEIVEFIDCLFSDISHLTYIGTNSIDVNNNRYYGKSANVGFIEFMRELVRDFNHLYGKCTIDYEDYSYEYNTCFKIKRALSNLADDIFDKINDALEHVHEPNFIHDIDLDVEDFIRYLPVSEEERLRYQKKLDEFEFRLDIPLVE